MSALTELDAAERYHEVAGVFTDRVAGTQDWDAPTPVAQWRARDVVDHLVTWFPALVAAGSEARLEPGPSAQDDPVAAWAHLDAQVRRLLDDPASAEVPFSHEHIGGPPMPLPAMVDQFFTSDVLFHTWDLARATGQDDTLDEDFIAGALAGMEQMEDAIRGSGEFGEQQPVPEDATVQERFFAFIGRDPRWAPPPASA